jgi:hypothetical protein
MTELDTLRTQLATDVLVMARLGHMPDSYWVSDPRVLRARQVLGLDSASAARDFADSVIDVEEMS